MGLYEMLAEALSRPSKAYLAAQEGIGALEKAGEGYLKGVDIADRLRQRKLAQMTLSQVLGGTPTGYEDFANIPLETISTIAPVSRFRQDVSPINIITSEEAVKRGTVPPKTKIVNTPNQTGFQTVEWDSASPADKALAKAAYEGNVRIQDLGFRDKGIVTKLANEYARVNGLAPFKSYAGAVAGATAQAFATGKQGQNVNSLNTALGHANDVLDAYTSVAKTDARLLNKPLNILAAQTNDPNIIKLQTSVNALAGELATTFKNSSGTDQEIGHWLNVLSQDLTPSQAYGAITQVNRLLNSRLNALEFQRRSGMSGRGEMPLLSPHGREVNKRLSEEQSTTPFAGISDDELRRIASGGR